MSTAHRAFADLVEIVRVLRSPEGCPWDRAQSHESLRSDVLEEAYEFVDAVDDRDAAQMAEELGDLLINVALHAQIAAEAGAFDMDAVLDAANAKLVRRHPHVFADGEARTPEAVLRRWDVIKQGEAGYDSRLSRLDGVPRSLPALAEARKLQAKAARVGFDWERAEQVLPKLREELGEIEAHMAADARADEDIAIEVGDLLFAAVNLARLLGVDPELALRRSNAKFVRRFRRMETMLEERGESFDQHDLRSLDVLWGRIKQEERA